MGAPAFKDKSWCKGNWRIAGGNSMVIIAGILLGVIAAVICVFAGVVWKDSIGQNMGRKHRKEEWGFDEKEEYHK